jgi:hypothetical protein
MNGNQINQEEVAKELLHIQIPDSFEKKNT